MKLADDLAKRFPEDTPVQFEYLPILRALVLLDKKSPSDAIERLQTALPYDLAMPGNAHMKNKTLFELGEECHECRNKNVEEIVRADLVTETRTVARLT